MRYLRWSNLVRRHFPIADGQDSVREEEDSVPESGASAPRPAVNGLPTPNGNGRSSGQTHGRNGSVPDDSEGGGDAAGRGKQRAHRYTFSDRGGSCVSHVRTTVVVVLIV